LILILHASARWAFGVIGIQDDNAAANHAGRNPYAAKNPFLCISANRHGFMMIVQWQGKQANSLCDPERLHRKQACDSAFFLS
jgi:hypothetical protein